LMRSGAGPLNASASHSPGLAALGFGVGVAGAADGVLGGAEEDAALVSSLGSVSPAWALTTRARRRGARAAAGTRTGSTPACAPAMAKAREPMEAITVAAVEVVVGGGEGDQEVACCGTRMSIALSLLAPLLLLWMVACDLLARGGQLYRGSWES
jgi:hypothetical protein